MTSGVKRAFTHSSIYALGNISRQLAGFLMLPVYTRHLTPTDYGVVALLMALMALVEVFFGARLAVAIPKFYFEERDPLQQKIIVSTAFLVTGSASLLTTAVLISLGDQASHLLFHTINYADAIKLFAVLILTQAIEYYAMTYIRIQQRPWLFITISLFKLFLQLSLNIWFVVHERMGVTGVALGSAISSLIFASGLAAYTFRHVGIALCKKRAIQMLKFSWPLWIGGLAGLFIGSSNRYFINIFSSTEDVGLFELAAKFSSILAMLIWEPFQQYWQSERYRVYQQQDAAFIYQVTFRIVSAFLIIGALGIGLFATPAIQLMASADFHNASKAVPILVIGTALNCLTFFVNFSLLVKDQTSWIARIDYLTAGVLAIFLVLLTPQWGFIGAAAAGSLAYGFQFLIINQKSKAAYDMKLPTGALLTYLSIAIGALSISTYLAPTNIWSAIGFDIVLFCIAGAGIVYIAIRDPELNSKAAQLAPPQLANMILKLRSK